MNNKLTVFLDLDGTIVDWLDKMRKECKLPISAFTQFYENPDSLTEEAITELFGGENKFRKLMYNRSAKFWYTLDSFWWMEYLIVQLKNNFNEVAFLTSPGDNPEAGKGKILWQQKHYPEIPLIMGKHKHLCAGPNKVLIDDNYRKIGRFIEYGGYGILWPNQFHVAKFNAGRTYSLISDIVAEILAYQKYHTLI